MLRYLIVGTFIASTVFASPAAAQSVDQDVRCVILSAAFQNVAKDAAQQQAASASTLYYLGRVNARVPSSDLKSRYLAQATRIKKKDAGPLMNACVRQLQVEEKSLNALRQDIARSAPKEAAPAKR